MKQKGLLTRVGEAIDSYRIERVSKSAEGRTSPMKRTLRWLIPNGGTLLIALLLVVTQSVWARGVLSTTSTSTNTISYQGRLADTGGSPITGLQNMEFRLYDVPVGGVALWEEFWTGGNAVQVSDGLFNVMLGSLNTDLTAIVQGETQLYLGITVDTDSEMLPRVQLGSVPFSMQALTVPDDSITNAKLTSNAVNSDTIIDGSVDTIDLANGSVTQDIAPSLVLGPSSNTKIAHGQAVANQNSANPAWGSITIPLSSYNFSQTPTVVCGLAGNSGAIWNCHVEYETNNKFTIWVYRLDGGTSWTTANVRWTAIGE